MTRHPLSVHRDVISRSPDVIPPGRDLTRASGVAEQRRRLAARRRLPRPALRAPRDVTGRSRPSTNRPPPPVPRSANQLARCVPAALRARFRTASGGGTAAQRNAAGAGPAPPALPPPRAERGRCGCRLAPTAVSQSGERRLVRLSRGRAAGAPVCFARGRRTARVSVGARGRAPLLLPRQRRGPGRPRGPGLEAVNGGNSPRRLPAPPRHRQGGPLATRLVRPVAAAGPLDLRQPPRPRPGPWGREGLRGEMGWQGVVYSR